MHAQETMQAADHGLSHAIECVGLRVRGGSLLRVYQELVPKSGTGAAGQAGADNPGWPTNEDRDSWQWSS